MCASVRKCVCSQVHACVGVCACARASCGHSCTYAGTHVFAVHRVLLLLCNLVQCIHKNVMDMCAHRWDLVTIVMLSYLTLSLPLRLGFELEPSGFGLWFERSTDLFFILDIFVNFRSHYFDVLGQEVKEPRKVAKNYLRTWFTIDFLSSIPFDWFLAGLGTTKARHFFVLLIYTIIYIP